MMKAVGDMVCAFDCEWVPDVAAGRALYHLPSSVPDTEVLRVMWEQGGATAETPQPFLKTVLCRLVSVATVVRQTLRDGSVRLAIVAIPEDPNDAQQDELYILKRFLIDCVSEKRPQLVGYNSRNADLRILTQRALIHGIQLPAFCARMAAKPWESADIDLMDSVAGFGRNFSCSLNEIATLCGIPGKLETTGTDVCGLWYAGKRRAVVEYNVYDALTTYLLWLRLTYFSGQFTAEAYAEEQRRVDLLLREMVAASEENAYLLIYRDAWRALHPEDPNLSFEEIVK